MPFHTRLMRLCNDAKVYLDPPDDLRRAFKIKRDTTKRGYTEEQVLRSSAGREGHSPRASSTPSAPTPTWSSASIRRPPAATPATATSTPRSLLLPTLPHPDLTDVLEHGGGSYDAGGADLHPRRRPPGHAPRPGPL